MHIGFTGTRYGMTDKQLSKVKSMVKLFNSFNDLVIHHGDCIGADSELHSIAKFLDIKVIIHPPIIDSLRAFCQLSHRDEILDPLDYMNRNYAIINSSSTIIAAPSQYTEQTRSGTWATIRGALNAKKRVIVVRPDGVVVDGERMVGR